MPGEWQEHLSQSVGGALTLEFKPAVGPEDLRFLLTVLPRRKTPGATPTPLDTRGLVTEQGGRLLRSSVEAVLSVKPLRGEETAGHYYSLTDRAPKPGEYKYLTQGVVVLGDVSFSFTVLTSTAGHPAREAALEALRRARLKLPEGPPVRR